MRIELIISSLQDWRLTITALEAEIRTSGIEPELCDWKSHSLPLTYIRINLKFFKSVRTYWWQGKGHKAKIQPEVSLNLKV